MAWNAANTKQPFGKNYNSEINVVTPDGGQRERRGDPSNPTQFAKDYLRPGFNTAQSMFNQGVGFNPYEGNRVANFWGDQNRYFTGLREKMGDTPTYLHRAQGNVRNVAESGGMSAGISDNISKLNARASGEATNPYFKDVLNQQLDDIQNRVNASTSGMGRYGSGAHTGVLTKELGNAASRALNDNYFGEQQLQMGALNSALQGNLSAQGQGLQASALAPSMQQAEIARLNELFKSGSIKQAHEQDIANARRDLHNEKQQAPWERLSAYLSSIGQPGAGSVMPQRAPTQQQPSAVQRGLGGALTGATIGGMFGNPLLGAVGGGALGLFG